MCASYIYNHYCDCKDQDYFLSGDKINDITCVSSENLTRVVPVLACQDRVLRVLQVYEIFQGFFSFEMLWSEFLLLLTFSVGVWACLWHGSAGPSFCFGTVQQKWRQVIFYCYTVAITCLRYTDLSVSHFSTGEEIVYGTTDGKVGLVQIGEQSATAKWEIDNVKKKGGMRFIPGFYLVAHKF